MDYVPNFEVFHLKRKCNYLYNANFIQRKQCVLVFICQCLL